jgi:hypothetical protein
MINPWYEVVDANAELTQGDLIFNCPLLTWQPGAFETQGADESETLKRMVTAIAADVVIMTQACDLSHGKVNNVILCPHLGLSEYRADWEAAMQAKNQTPSARAWRGLCDDICDGYVWNLTMLNGYEGDNVRIENRIVDFREMYTAPRSFLESLLRQRAQPRVRLLPPYREYLSQAFARFFMRVGLPIPTDKVW